MAILLNVKFWISIGVAGALTFAGFFLYRAGSASKQRQWDAAIIDSQELARNTEKARQADKDAAVSASAKRNAALAADSRSARDALARLRNTLTASIPGESVCSTDQRAIAAKELFAECAGLLQESSRAADAHASDVKLLLDSWPK